MSDKPRTLFEQLVDGGMLIAPVASGTEQIVLYTKRGKGIREERLKRCSFVPLKKGVV